MSPYMGKWAQVDPKEQQGSKLMVVVTEVTNNFFTSYDLGMELLQQKLALVGMVYSNKLNLHPQLEEEVKQQQFPSSVFTFTL